MPVATRCASFWGTLLIHPLAHSCLLSLACGSEVSHAAVVAPVAGAAPPQRLGLWPADLARPWVLFAIELGWRATPDTSRGGLVGLWR